MKKIFDVNALDLAKVGKAFGFSVPPRVNVNIGGGKTVGSGTAGKRKRPTSEDDITLEAVDVDPEAVDIGDDDNEHHESARGRGSGKQRRIEALGQKKFEKEIYKKGNERKRQSTDAQWSR